MLITQNDAAIKSLIEVSGMKSKNPIRYKINQKGQELFGIIKSNLEQMSQKMLKSLKMLLVRPSFEQQFNSQFSKIVNKLAQDGNIASKIVVERMKGEQAEAKLSLEASQISRLEKEIERMFSTSEIVKGEASLETPDYVKVLEETVGVFVIPENNEIVHEKFVNLTRKKAVTLDDGSIYEGQWSAEATR